MDKDNTKTPIQKKRGDLGVMNSANRRQQKFTNSAHINKNGKLSPCTPLTKSKVFDFEQEKLKNEDYFNQINIDHFEVWDWVEIKFDGMKEEQVMESFDVHNLYYEAGI